MVPGAIEIVAGANGGIVRDDAKAAGYVHSDCGTAFPFTNTESGVGNPLRRYADTIPLNSWAQLVLSLVCSV